MRIKVVGVVAALLSVVAFSQCLVGCSTSDDQVPILHDDSDYVRVMGQVQQLTIKPFQKADDASLTKEEQHDLEVAALKMQGLIAYNPSVYTNYFIAGKIAFLLQDYNTAQRNFYACVSMPWPEGDDKNLYISTTSEAHYMLSKCYFLQHQYQQASYEASIAVKHEPQDPLYRLAEAESEFQMGHDTTARGILIDVLRIQPSNTRAQMLLQMIGSPKSAPSPSHSKR